MDVLERNRTMIRRREWDEDRSNRLFENFMQEVKTKGHGQIREYLQEDSDTTLKNLLWATDTQKIFLDREPGKMIWKGVFRYLEELNTPKATEIIELLEKRLYEICATEDQKALNLFKGDFVYSLALFAVLPCAVGYFLPPRRPLFPFEVRETFIRRDKHKYVTKELSSDIIYRKTG